MHSTNRDRKTLDVIIRARRRLTRLGLVEDSGERRRSSAGGLQIVWRLTPLGEAVAQFQDLGLAFDEAVAKARAMMKQVQ